MSAANAISGGNWRCYNVSSIFLQKPVFYTESGEYLFCLLPQGLSTNMHEPGRAPGDLGTTGLVARVTRFVKATPGTSPQGDPLRGTSEPKDLQLRSVALSILWQSQRKFCGGFTAQLTPSCGQHQRRQHLQLGAVLVSMLWRS